MPQSLSKVMIHLIFSTKHRRACIAPETCAPLHAYIVGTLKNLGCPSIRTGGVSDHVHILYLLNRTTNQATVVEKIKTASSKWMKSDGGVSDFSWQLGYGAFSISESQIDQVVRYIDNQDEHHKTVTFQEEFRKFLEKYRIDYDERYVWD